MGARVGLAAAYQQIQGPMGHRMAHSSSMIRALTPGRISSTSSSKTASGTAQLPRMAEATMAHPPCEGCVCAASDLACLCTLGQGVCKRFAVAQRCCRHSRLTPSTSSHSTAFERWQHANAGWTGRLTYNWQKPSCAWSQAAWLTRPNRDSQLTGGHNADQQSNQQAGLCVYCIQGQVAFSASLSEPSKTNLRHMVKYSYA